MNGGWIMPRLMRRGGGIPAPACNTKTVQNNRGVRHSRARHTGRARPQNITTTSRQIRGTQKPRGKRPVEHACEDPESRGVRDITLFCPANCICRHQCQIMTALTVVIITACPLGALTAINELALDESLTGYCRWRGCAGTVKAPYINGRTNPRVAG